MRRNIEPKEQIKSYRQRRAQSRTNHMSSTDSKGLQQIQENLKKRRMSIQKGESLFGSFCGDDGQQQQPTERYRTHSFIGQQKQEQTQSTKIIQKYGDTIDFIKQDEQDLLISGNIPNPQEKPKAKYPPVIPLLKTIASQQSKKLNTTTKTTPIMTKTASKNTTQSQNITTPRKTLRQPVPRTTMNTTSSKSDRRMIADTKSSKKQIKVSKLQQTRFIKKLQSIQQQMGKLGFQKQAEAKWHLKNILQLLKQ